MFLYWTNMQISPALHRYIYILWYKLVSKPWYITPPSPIKNDLLKHNAFKWFSNNIFILVVMTVLTTSSKHTQKPFFQLKRAKFDISLQPWIFLLILWWNSGQITVKPTFLWFDWPSQLFWHWWMLANVTDPRGS